MNIQHKKNTAYYLSFPMIDSASPESFATGLTPTDTAYYKDGAGAWTSLAITDTAAQIGSTGVYEIDLSASEMNHDKVLIKFTNAGAADTAFLFDMTTNTIDDAVTDIATVDANVDAILVDTGTTLPAAIATIDTNVDAILVDTGTTIPGTITTLQADTDDIQTRLPAALVGGKIDANMGAISSSTTAADNLEASALGIHSTTVATSSSATEFTLTAGSTVDDTYIGRVVVVTSGTHAGEATNITDYVGSTKTVTVTAFTAALGIGDSIVIV